MRRVWGRLGLILWLTLFVAACTPPQAGGDTGGYTIALSVVPSAPAVGSANLIVTLTDSAGAAVTGAQVALEGNMSHAGMVPVLAEAAPEGEGRYVADFRFTMAGDWIVTVKATLAGGTVIQQNFDLRVASAE